MKTSTSVRNSINSDQTAYQILMHVDMKETHFNCCLYQYNLYNKVDILIVLGILHIKTFQYIIQLFTITTFICQETTIITVNPK